MESPPPLLLLHSQRLPMQPPTPACASRAPKHGGSCSKPLTTGSSRSPYKLQGQGQCVALNALPRVAAVAVLALGHAETWRQGWLVYSGRYLWWPAAVIALAALASTQRRRLAREDARLRRVKALERIADETPVRVTSQQEVDLDKAFADLRRCIQNGEDMAAVVRLDTWPGGPVSKEAEAGKELSLGQLQILMEDAAKAPYRPATIKRLAAEIEQLQVALDWAADYDCRANLGRYALDSALGIAVSESRNEAMAILLLELGLGSGRGSVARLNSGPLLREAATHGMPRLVEVLVERCGADINARDPKTGAVPLDKAVEAQRDKTALTLLDLGADPNAGAAPGAAGSGGGAGTWLEQLPRALDAEGRPGFTHFPPYGHMQGVMLPERRLVVGNQPNPYKFENENCWGLMLPMLRPTADRQFDRPGGWHFGDHFEGKKRLWEFRLEFHLKRPLPGDVHFGIQLEQYVPVGAAAKRLMAVTVGMLRSSLGSNIYHSPGDDPAMVSGEREPPTFTMPLWAFDQFIETPEGEAPPTLDDSRFPELGVRRNKDRRAFLKQMRDVKMRPGPTYTFAFWGIAQYMDTVQWEIRNVMLWHIDFNQFCKAPPVRLVLYALDESQGDEKRHLESRKWYLLNTLFWSSVKPASREKISSFFPRVADGVAEKRSGKGLSPGQGFGFLSCCTARE